ncbi:MAG: DEAD/DEAH box helicase [Acidobacteria bacterium]|nr:DEAD/DEAH box helicase [Acidobacteriota bacterium]
MPENLSLGFPDFSLEPAPVRPSGLEAALARFQSWSRDANSPIRAIHHRPATPAELAGVPEPVDPRLQGALAAQGIQQLYSHQARAFDLVWAGNNVVVVTPTASGKTLCYNLPVLNSLLEDPEMRAMYLFPTKALAEDQLDELQSLVDAMGAPVRAFTYDGDTPQDARKAIRERANVVLTNPDMLHTGILPHHTRWAKAFEKLRYFVIDELHYYRGVYGSHLANIIRRLKRVCAFYGSKPRFIASSATIANPRELAQALCEEPFELVGESGAPTGEKYFIFYNPPVVNRELGIRRGYLQESKRLALEFLERGQQTLVFANSRLATEVLVTYLKDAWGRAAGEVRGYRGGYLPRERREIERKLRDGDIRCVVATNALELGIDIGSLDAAVLAGYPGCIASTWQRAGRAGRRTSTSAAVLVASSAPLDQYIVEHPEYFFGQSPEHARINPDNLEILISHLKCAAFELPIRDGEKFGPHPTAEMCKFLDELGLLHHTAGAWHWTSDTYPADAISLRSITSDNFVVVDITGEPQAIALVDFPWALTALHEKAIYLHEARQYQVERFDYDGRMAYVRRVECDYYTDAIDYTQVKVLQEFASSPVSQARSAHGEVRVNRQVVGFKKIKFYTMENVGAGNLSMPEQEMHTTAFWLHFPAAFLESFGDLSVTEKQNGLTGLGNVLRSVAAFLLMSDPRDLGLALGEEISQGLKVFEPDLFLYDAYPGGVGLSAPLFEMTTRLLEHARDLIAACRCEEGCPSCVGPVGEVGARGKEAATRILEALLAGSQESEVRSQKSAERQPPHSDF